MAVINLSTRYAFPLAKGFGRAATGGRGGYIVEVTNLNDSGTGSLRAALLMTGARTIIFRVGGTINCSNFLDIGAGKGNVTIAGETAPGGGILIKNGELRISASNVIVRHLRFRQSNSSTGSNEDCINVTAYSGNVVENVVIDHVSMCWARDENISFVGGFSGSIVRNCTVQNSIMSENTYGALTNKDTYKVSFLNNYLAHNTERNIRANYHVASQLKFEMINNIVFGYRAGTGPTLGLTFSVLNNYYKRSNAQTPTLTRLVNGEAISSGETSYLGSNANAALTYAYIKGNVSADGYGQWATNLNSYIETTPHASSGYESEMLDANILSDVLLPHVGASKPSRDSVDSRLISEFATRGGSASTTPVFPTISNGTPYTDSNGDGIADSWASTHGISSATQVKGTYTINGHTINNTAGYTALEIFLADLAGDFDNPDLSNEIPVISLIGSSTINLTVGDNYTESGATASDPEDGSLTANIVITGTVNTSVAGSYYKYYNVQDSNGNNALQVVRTINVFSGPPPDPNPVTHRGVHKNLFWSI